MTSSKQSSTDYSVINRDLPIESDYISNGIVKKAIKEEKSSTISPPILLRCVTALLAT
jgi:hypothetical protein